MNELEMIKSQITDINNKRVRIQTLIEQASKQCEEIEQKYNVKSLEELQALMEKSEQTYQQQVQEAKEYIETTNKALAEFNGI